MTLPLELGTTVDNYRLDSVLGQGGMGCVYAATDVRLGRVVALKVLAPELAASSEYVSRFLEEARIVNNVRHPNIVDIPVFIEQEGLVAYAMEYVQGVPLSRLLREGPLTVRQAVNISFQLASALEAVHAQGVVHRDLKPDNIIVLGDRSGDFSHVPCLKILDFGIAKSNSVDVAHKTVTGSMLGTPSYMAPEQVAAAPVSAATDLYAVAEMLYEMVAGQRVFAADTPMDILRMKLAEQPPELTWPDVPGWQRLDQIVQAGLQAHPEDRLSLAELVMGLNETLTVQPDAPTLTPPIQGALPPLAPTPRPAATPAVPPAVAAPPPAAPMEANTPVNMQSVVALPPPRPLFGRLAAPVGAALLLAAAAIAAFAYFERPGSTEVIAAESVAPAVTPAAAEPPAPAAAAPVPAPEPAAPPAAVAPEEAPKAQASAKKKRRAKKRRARRRAAKRRAAPAPAPVPSEAPAPAAPTVVKKSEMKGWE